MSNTGKWWCNKISCSKILFLLQPWHVSTYAQKNTRKQNIHFLVTRKQNSVSKTPKLSISKTQILSVSKTPNLSISETPKQNSISTPLETKFCFHSTQNKILFPLHLKQNFVSGLHYSINPNTLLWYNDTHHCANHLTWRLLLVIVIQLLPFTLLFLVTALLVFLPTLITSCLGFVLRSLPMM